MDEVITVKVYDTPLVSPVIEQRKVSEGSQPLTQPSAGVYVEHCSPAPPVAAYCTCDWTECRPGISREEKLQVTPTSLAPFAMAVTLVGGTGSM
jgi:hypothetical protein